MPKRLPPVKFRKGILEPVTELLRVGESCALVRANNSGKSTIAHHLTRGGDLRAFA